MLQSIVQKKFIVSMILNRVKYGLGMVSPLLLICIDLVDTLCHKVGHSHCVQADPIPIAVSVFMGHHESFSTHSKFVCAQLLLLFCLCMTETRGVLAWKHTCLCFTSLYWKSLGSFSLEHSFLFYNIITTLWSLIIFS